MNLLNWRLEKSNKKTPCYGGFTLNLEEVYTSRAKRKKGKYISGFLLIPNIHLSLLQTMLGLEAYGIPEIKRKSVMSENDRR